MVFELRQAKQLALAELASEGYSDTLNMNYALMGENPAAVIAKSCNKPGDLTNADLVVLDALYRAQLEQVARTRDLEMIADFGLEWESGVRTKLYALLSSAPGRHWYEVNLAREPSIREIAEEILKEAPDCSDYYQYFRTDPLDTD